MFLQSLLLFLEHSIDETSLHYSINDSMTTIADAPFILNDNVWGYLFGLNMAISPAGGRLSHLWKTKNHIAS